MRILELIGSKRVELEERSMSLDYFLRLKEEAVTGHRVYGVSIVKTEQGISVEEVVEGITYSREDAEELVHSLFKYTVTPISMLESLDILLDERRTS